MKGLGPDDRRRHYESLSDAEVDAIELELLVRYNRKRIALGTVDCEIAALEVMRKQFAVLDGRP